MWSISGFDVTDFSEDGPDDLEGLDASAAHVANLLSTEPADSKFLFSVHFYAQVNLFSVTWFFRLCFLVLIVFCPVEGDRCTAMN